MTNQINFRRIRPVLAIDALTCLGAGALMTFGAGLLASLTALHPDLLRFAGLALFPVAALFFYMSRTPELNRGLIQFAVIGNIGWVLGSVAVLLLAGGNLFGQLFVAAQAIVVAVLALLEARNGFSPAASAGALPGQ